MDLIVLGYIERITAGHDTVLHLRPKTSNGKALAEAVGKQGQLILALPHSFYLKKNFSFAVLATYFLI